MLNVRRSAVVLLLIAVTAGCSDGRSEEERASGVPSVAGELQRCLTRAGLQLLREGSRPPWLPGGEDAGDQEHASTGFIEAGGLEARVFEPPEHPAPTDYIAYVVVRVSDGVKDFPGPEEALDDGDLSTSVLYAAHATARQDDAVDACFREYEERVESRQDSG